MAKHLQILPLLLMSIAAFSQAKAPPVTAPVPRYDKAMEAVFKGTVEEVRDHQCPVSGGIGSHLMMRLSAGKVVEVHLATTHFVHQYEVTFHSGEALEITGVQVTLEGADTILARKIKRGSEEFLFRDNDGKPIW
jgi:hypothetical protein